MEVVSCGIHGLGETIGIDVNEIRVYWKLSFVSEHATQAEYQVVISTDRDFFSQSAVSFDSGRCESDAQRNIVCKPDGGFHSTTFYYWTVRVWDQNGQEALSEVNEFYTAYPRSSRLLPPYSMNQTYVCPKSRGNLTSPFGLLTKLS